jgi:hypothetical protein
MSGRLPTCPAQAERSSSDFEPGVLSAAHHPVRDGFLQNGSMMELSQSGPGEHRGWSVSFTILVLRWVAGRQLALPNG